MKSSSKKILAAAGLFSFLLLAVLGCKGPRPLAPAQNVNLGVSVSPSKEVQASLLGTTSNTLLWNVRGTSDTGEGVHGQEGPFASGAGAGNVDFSISLPAGSVKVLSVQLNDATTNQPLAVGAVKIDLTNPSSGMSVTLLLGSVVRDCYVLDGASIYTYYDFNDHLVTSYTIGQGADPGDTEVYPGYTNYQLFDPLYDFISNSSPYESIAYLGNGNLVDFDYVPSNNVFSYSSGVSKSRVLDPSSGIPTPVPTFVGTAQARKNTKGSTVSTLDLETGDIYCIKLVSLSNAYAWVQVIDPGNYSNSTGPSFRFRISTDPFFSYYQTSGDQLQNCSWNGGGGGGFPGGGGGE
jgi:hypothetical protein